MADTEFDLGEALGGYEQAQADRNFYLSMVQGGTQMASPIAAYLAGVSGVKLANMRAKAQTIEDRRTAEKDAIAATERANKRAMDLDNQIISIMKGARDGSIDPSAAAGMLGYAMKERGYIPKGYDADNNIMRYGVPGDTQDYQVDLGESETSKASRDLARIALQERKEARLATAAENKAKQDAINLKIKQVKYDKMVAGETDKNNTAQENQFIKINQDIFNLINKPSALDKFENVTERLQHYVENNPDAGLKWISGLETLPEEAKKRINPISRVIAYQLSMDGKYPEIEFERNFKEGSFDVSKALKPQASENASQSLDAIW